MRKLDDANGYLARMRTDGAMMEKLWFVPRMGKEIETVVDFGCADGSLLRRLPEQYEKYGIEENPEFREKCRGLSVFPGLTGVPTEPEKTGLILSSVVHELFSYKDGWAELEKIAKRGFREIYLRDMAGLPGADGTSAWYRDAREKLFRLRNSDIRSRFTEFVVKWGAKNENDILHFLLKYRYVENWPRERDENYLPVGFATLVQFFAGHGYVPVYCKTYTNGFIYGHVMRDTGISLAGIPTHVQAQFRKVF